MSASQLRALQAELSALRLRVESQEERISDLEAEREQREFGEVGTGKRFEPSEAAEVRSISLGSFSEVSVAVGGRASGPVSESDIEGRLELARACGGFLSRALAGDFRGSSGRDRLRLASEVYVIAADFFGNTFNPPKICHSFGQVKGLCKRGSSCGRAVFIGLPSTWEAKEAVQAAGLIWAEKA